MTVTQLQCIKDMMKPAMVMMIIVSWETGIVMGMGMGMGRRMTVDLQQL